MLYGNLVFIKKTGGDGSKYPVTEKKIKIGRSEKCLIRIHNPQVALEHCELFIDDHGQAKLKNLSNSTILNGKQLSQGDYALCHGDIFKIGERLARWEYLPSSNYYKQLLSPSGRLVAVIKPQPRSLEKEMVSRSSASQSSRNTPSGGKSRFSDRLSSSFQPQTSESGSNKNNVKTNSTSKPHKNLNNIAKFLSSRRSLQVPKMPFSPKIKLRKSTSGLTGSKTPKSSSKTRKSTLPSWKVNLVSPENVKKSQSSPLEIKNLSGKLSEKLTKSTRKSILKTPNLKTITESSAKEEKSLQSSSRSPSKSIKGTKSVPSATPPKKTSVKTLRLINSEKKLNANRSSPKEKSRLSLALKPKSKTQNRESLKKIYDTLSKSSPELLRTLKSHPKEMLQSLSQKPVTKSELSFTEASSEISKSSQKTPKLSSSKSAKKPRLAAGLDLSPVLALAKGTPAKKSKTPVKSSSSVDQLESSLDSSQAKSPVRKTPGKSKTPTTHVSFGKASANTVRFSSTSTNKISSTDSQSGKAFLDKIAAKSKTPATPLSANKTNLTSASSKKSKVGRFSGKPVSLTKSRKSRTDLNPTVVLIRNSPKKSPAKTKTPGKRVSTAKRIGSSTKSVGSSPVKKLLRTPEAPAVSVTKQTRSSSDSSTKSPMRMSSPKKLSQKPKSPEESILVSDPKFSEKISAVAVMNKDIGIPKKSLVPRKSKASPSKKTPVKSKSPGKRITFGRSIKSAKKATPKKTPTKTRTLSLPGRGRQSIKNSGAERKSPSQKSPVARGIRRKLSPSIASAEQAAKKLKTSNPKKPDKNKKAALLVLGKANRKQLLMQNVKVLLKQKIVKKAIKQSTAPPVIKDIKVLPKKVIKTKKGPKKGLPKRKKISVKSGKAKSPKAKVTTEFRNSGSSVTKTLQFSAEDTSKTNLNRSKLTSPNSVKSPIETEESSKQSKKADLGQLSSSKQSVVKLSPGLEYAFNSNRRISKRLSSKNGESRPDFMELSPTALGLMPKHVDFFKTPKEMKRRSLSLTTPKNLKTGGIIKSSSTSKIGNRKSVRFSSKDISINSTMFTPNTTQGTDFDFDSLQTPNITMELFVSPLSEKANSKNNFNTSARTLNFVSEIEVESSGKSPKKVSGKKTPSKESPLKRTLENKSPTKTSPSKRGVESKSPTKTTSSKKVVESKSPSESTLSKKIMGSKSPMKVTPSKRVSESLSPSKASSLKRVAESKSPSEPSLSKRTAEIKSPGKQISEKKVTSGRETRNSRDSASKTSSFVSPRKSNNSKTESARQLFSSPRQESPVLLSPRGVKRLSSTPKDEVALKKSARDKVEVQGSTKIIRSQKSPKNDLTDVSGVKKLMKTPRVQKNPKNGLTDVAGVKKLMKTPREHKSPKNDLSDVKGIKRLLRTPREQKSPKNDLTNISGVKKLMKTPKQQKSPKNDLTDVRGVKRLMKTPREQKSPKNDLTDVAGVKQLMKTPRQQKSPKNDLSDVAGVKQLMKTPRQQKSPKNDLSDVAGVKQLMKTPRQQKSPKNDLSDVAGVKQLMKTPRQQKSPKNDLSDVAGVKQLMKTPRQQKSPKNDLTDVRGIKRLMNTPREVKSPKNDLSDLRGVRQLLGSSKAQKSPRNDLTDVTGVRKLLATPHTQRSPKNDLMEISGVGELFSTPKSPRSPKDNSENIRGVKQLLIAKSPSSFNNSKSLIRDFRSIRGRRTIYSTPKGPKNDLSDVTGVRELFARHKPISDYNINYTGVAELFDLSTPTVESVKKTYGRKSTRINLTKVEELEGPDSKRKKRIPNKVKEPETFEGITQETITRTVRSRKVAPERSSRATRSKSEPSEPLKATRTNKKQAVAKLLDSAKKTTKESAKSRSTTRARKVELPEIRTTKSVEEPTKVASRKRKAKASDVIEKSSSFTPPDAKKLRRGTSARATSSRRQMTSKSQEETSTDSEKATVGAKLTRPTKSAKVAASKTKTPIIALKATKVSGRTGRSGKAASKTSANKISKVQTKRSQSGSIANEAKSEKKREEKKEENISPKKTRSGKTRAVAQEKKSKVQTKTVGMKLLKKTTAKKKTSPVVKRSTRRK